MINRKIALFLALISSVPTIVISSSQPQPSSREENLGYLLHEAIQCHRFEDTKRLLELGASPNFCFNGETPLHKAVKFDNTEDLRLITILLKNGADANAKNKKGIPPLFYVGIISSSHMNYDPSTKKCERYIPFEKAFLLLKSVNVNEQIEAKQYGGPHIYESFNSIEVGGMSFMHLVVIGMKLAIEMHKAIHYLDSSQILDIDKSVQKKWKATNTVKAKFKEYGLAIADYGFSFINEIARREKEKLENILIKMLTLLNLCADKDADFSIQDKTGIPASAAIESTCLDILNKIPGDERLRNGIEELAERLDFTFTLDRLKKK